MKTISKVSRKNIIASGIVASVIILSVFFVINSFSPVNSNTLIFAPSTNISLKAVKSPDGYHYSHTKGGKSVPNMAGSSPPIVVTKGNLIQIHLINEEKNQYGDHSKHNLNIDEFNVHTKNLGYFETDSVLFLADKTGTFEYYCSIHSDMKGIMTVIDK